MTLILFDIYSNAQQDPNAGNGVCQDTLQGINDFVKNLDKASQAAQYKCLLNLLCVYVFVAPLVLFASLSLRLQGAYGGPI